MVGFSISSEAQNTSLVGNPQTGEIFNNYPLQDSVMKLAEEGGMVDMANRINSGENVPLETQDTIREESIENTPEEEPVIEETQEEVPKEPAPAKSSKKKQDKRLDEYHYKIAQLEREKEEYANRLSHLEYQLLHQNKQQIEDRIQGVSDVMKLATSENDVETYVEANKILSTLTNENLAADRELYQAQEALKTFQEQKEREAEGENENHRRAELLQTLSHKKELDSEDYQDWLDENPLYDPYSSDFDPDLTAEMADVKKDFNKFLSARGHQQFIGSSQYYQELDTILNTQKQERYGLSPVSVRNNPPVYQSQPSYKDTKPMARYVAPVASVNRDGYQTSSYERNNQLPALSEEEKAIALMCPIPVGPPRGQGDIPRMLTPQERILDYQKQKARLMGMRIE